MRNIAEQNLWQICQTKQEEFKPLLNLSALEEMKISKKIISRRWKFVFNEDCKDKLLYSLTSVDFKPLLEWDGNVLVKLLIK